MNFQGLKKIENSEFYIDLAFRKASKRVDLLRGTTKAERIDKSRTLEMARLSSANDVLVDSLKAILEGFPRIEQLDKFYQELIKATLDFPALKKSLGSVNWAVMQVLRFYKIYQHKIKATKDIRLINKYRKEYFGRVSSIMKQLAPFLEYLEECRKTMKRYPAVKTSVYTVCISGFPNAGKSTLLKALTDASPEIDDYAFTTKNLNLGYYKKPGTTIQFIDTPGTLNRTDKMNLIELQAYLAVKHLADAIIFVFDPTLQYSYEQQKELYLRLSKMQPNIIPYLSKSDITESSAFDEFSPLTDKEELMKIVLSKQ